MSSLLHKLKKHYVNYRGLSLGKKIVIFESDDWGSIRIRDAQAAAVFQKAGIASPTNNFHHYDTLESQEDLRALFELLGTFKDHRGQAAKFTPVALVANPDFVAIGASQFQKYAYQTLAETYQEYYGSADTLDYWREQGIATGLFVPQFHGREHLNPHKWLQMLRKGDERELLAFKHRSLLGLRHADLSGSGGYLAAFEWSDREQEAFVAEMIPDGLDLFEQTFGFKSVSFASSQGIQHESDNEILRDNGVQFHQLGQYFVPVVDGKPRLKNRFWGDTNAYGQVYWRRNARFEPSKLDPTDWVASCLWEMGVAFQWGKPAVISTHRVNFVGGISVENRNKNLDHLGRLITSALRKWPDLEFYNSVEMSELLAKKLL